MKNDKFEGKGIFYMVINIMLNGKMVNLKERE